MENSLIARGAGHEQEFLDLINSVERDGNYLRWSLGQNYAVAAMTVLYYDYILTFTTERELLWSNYSITSVTLLFLRYLSLVAHVVIGVVLFGINWDGRSPDKFLIFPKIFQCVATACVTLIMVIRVHCMYNKKWIAWLLGLIWLVTNAANTVAWVTATPGHANSQTSSFLFPIECTNTLAGETGYTISGHAWGSRMNFEMVMLAMIIGRAWYIQGFGCRLKVPILRLLTKHGIIYFFIVYVSECASMFIIASAVSVRQVMFNTVQISAISRLVFELYREVKEHPQEVTTGQRLSQRLSEYPRTSMPLFIQLEAPNSSQASMQEPDSIDLKEFDGKDPPRQKVDSLV